MMINKIRRFRDVMYISCADLMKKVKYLSGYMNVLVSFDVSGANS